MLYENELRHHGTPRHSGRYPWGSGKEPQRSKDFLGMVSELKKQGLSETQIAEGFGMNTSQLRARKALSKATARAASQAEAQRLKDKGMSTSAIGRQMGLNESSVRSLLDPAKKERNDITKNIANTLKDRVNETEFVDVGIGVERYLGVSRTRLNNSIALLQEEGGYKLSTVKVEQLGTGKFTTMKVLTKEEVPYGDIVRNREKIAGIGAYSEDNGRTVLGLEPVKSVDGKRVMIRYGDEGGADKDGVIEIRSGVPDISLGHNRYAQVRVGVDDKYFMKGMAMYTDDLPAGIDMIYNTNKPKGTPAEKVYKPMKTLADGGIDDDNPFGSTVKQRHYIDENGKRQLSSMNIVNEEGTWNTWSKNLSSQVLSKQQPKLIREQLELATKIRQEEFDAIDKLTNPVVRQKLMEEFAGSADNAAVTLKAAAMPRQSTKVLLPLPGLKDGEVYAPTYKNGETVVLIRHPHGGIFEIPSLKVNNNFPDGKKFIGNALDAIGINPKTAEQLSGADFDGDAAIVIPNNNGKIKYSSPLKQLEGFDPKTMYPAYPGMPKIKTNTKEGEMGKVSNLITDMTIKGAKPDEIARAVKHSMVVIDSEKHNLNYKQSFQDNGIAQLKEKYQGSSKAGASTLISRAGSEARVGTRKERIDPATGKKYYEYTNETYINKKGETVLRTTKSKKGYETDDAFTLSSGSEVETIYAGYANTMKGMADEARKIAVNTKYTAYSPAAKKQYASEVASLDKKLNTALMNAPLERQAQLLANSIVGTKKQQNPGMDNDALKKIKGQALNEARVRTGANKTRVDITPNEWEAIQAGAISTNKLRQILDNGDSNQIKQYATPRATNKESVSSSASARIKSMLNNGYTQAEIADAVGLSVSTIQEFV